MRPVRAFTILELLLALSLASIVIGTIIGLYAVMGRATADLSEGVGTDFDRIVAYEAMQRTMQELVAATPLTPSAAGAASDDPSSTRDPDGGPLLGRVDQGPAGTTTGAQAQFLPTVSVDQPVMFDLSWVDLGDGVVVQRMELVTLRSPLPIDILPDEELDIVPTDQQRARWEVPDRVRSVFEFVRLPEGDWALAWRPLDPPGRAQVLVRDLEWAEWSALPRSKESNASEARKKEGWQDVMSSFLKIDFPIGVRLRFKTIDGPERDWLFETLVEPREY